MSYSMPDLDLGRGPWCGHCGSDLGTKVRMFVDPWTELGRKMGPGKRVYLKCKDGFSRSFCYECVGMEEGPYGPIVPRADSSSKETA